MWRCGDFNLDRTIPFSHYDCLANRSQATLLSSKISGEPGEPSKGQTARKTSFFELTIEWPGHAQSHEPPGRPFPSQGCQVGPLSSTGLSGPHPCCPAVPQPCPALSSGGSRNSVQFSCLEFSGYPSSSTHEDVKVRG